MASTSTRGSSISGSLVGIIRCNVRLPNGLSIRVPVVENSTISQLLDATITRATKMVDGFDCTTSNSALMLGGEEAAHLYEGDTIDDVVAEPARSTFVLVARGTRSATPAQLLQPVSPYMSTRDLRNNATQHPRVIPANHFVVRWIYPNDAATARTISSIPADYGRHLPFTTTVADLIVLASIDLPEEFKPILYTQSCEIMCPHPKTTCITELGLIQSNTEPVSIFVVPVRGAVTDLKTALPFDCTDRGTATFMTCLEVLISKIGKDDARREAFLQVIWELTHFPPAVIALKHMFSLGRLEPHQCAIFASSFKALCELMAPDTFSMSPESTLEISRQVFSWICSLQPTSSPTFKPAGPIIHKVEIRRADRPSELSINESDRHEEVVEVPILLATSLTPLTGESSQQTQQLIVRKQRDSSVSARSLAMAMNNGSNDAQHYWFFNWSPTTAENDQKRDVLSKSFFTALLRTTNTDLIFRLVGPFQLSQCPGSVLPVITLDTSGHVSLYSNGYLGCEQMFTYTQNVISGEQKLPATEPAQFLFQELQSHMSERKSKGTWDIDAWQEESIGTFGGSPYEAIVVCADISSSMATAMPKSWLDFREHDTTTADEMTRLSEVREFFTNFVIRLNAYRVSADLGLLTFSSQENVKVRQPLTRAILDFKDALNTISATGCTAAWDGIKKGCDMLVSHKTKHPNAKLRLVVLTDGEDNDSTRLPSNICAELHRHDIVLDAIVIGTNATQDLFKMAKHTGGYAFHPKSRMALFQIFLLENFVDIKTRPEIVKTAIADYHISIPKAADLRDIFDFPPCRPHQNQQDHFIALADAELFLRKSQGRSRAGRISSRDSVATTARSSATRILHDQVQIALQSPHDYMDIYVSESNMGFWKVVMQGRPDTPYARGTFLAYVEIGDDYPLKPPNMRFITPILHPNISKHGRICHQVFDKGWQSSFSILQVLQHVWDMLVLTDSEDAIDPISTVRFYTDPESAQRLIKTYIDRFALKTSPEHRLDICGSESDMPSDISSVTSTSFSFRSPPSYTSGSPLQLPGDTSTRSSLALTAAALRNHQRSVGQTLPRYQDPNVAAPSQAGSDVSSATLLANTPTESVAATDVGSFVDVYTPSVSSVGRSRRTSVASRRLNFFRQFR